MYQTNTDLSVRFKAQSALGTPASGSGAQELRISEGAALNRLTKGIIENPEIVSDGLGRRGRHGSKKSAGSYQFVLAEAEASGIIEALLRTTLTASIAITQADVTSITTTTNTIVGASGSFLTLGVRRGSLVKLTNHSTSANNGKWFRVLSVTASTITLPANSLTTDAAPDSSFTLDVAKSAVSGVTPTERYFTVEEYALDIDISRVWTDQKIHRLEISCQPNAIILCTVTFAGLDGTAFATGASPTFSSPTRTTSRPLVMSDGTIRILGSDQGQVLTAFSLIYEMNAAVPDVLAPSPPDVFLGKARASGSFAALVTDQTLFDAFRNETAAEIFVHATSNEADPKPFASFYLGDCVLDSNDPSAAGDGPRIETINYRAGKDEGGTDRAATILKYSTSV